MKYEVEWDVPPLVTDETIICHSFLEMVIVFSFFFVITAVFLAGCAYLFAVVYAGHVGFETAVLTGLVLLWFR